MNCLGPDGILTRLQKSTRQQAMFPFDLSHLTEEQLHQLLQSVQAELLERQRMYLRECSIEQIYKRIMPKAQKVWVFLLTREDEWTNRTQLAELVKREVEPAFDPFTARVGAVLELQFIVRRSQSGFRVWYVVCEDGALRRIDTDQSDFARAYLEGNLTLRAFLQRLYKDEFPGDLL